MKDKTQTTKRSFILRFLDMIEVAGNKLPTPLTIFFYLAVFVVVLSGIGAAMGWSATGERLQLHMGCRMGQLTGLGCLQKIMPGKFLYREGGAGGWHHTTMHIWAALIPQCVEKQN